jgi:hypothetical protein
MFEGGFGQVVEAIVEAVDAELRGQDRGVLKGFVEEDARELRAL